MTETVRETAQPKQTPQVRAAHIRVYREGEVILEAGEETPFFFVLLGGRVWIIQREKKIRLLEPQDTFGIDALVFQKPSFYTAKALTNARVAAYTSDAFDYFLRTKPRMIHNIISSTLRQMLQTSELLADKSPLLELGMDDARVRFYKDGDAIVEEGGPGTEFFRLVSTQGGLKVSIAGKEINRIEKPGEFFGEMATILNRPHNATVTSIGESVAEVFDANQFDVIVKEQPELALLLIRTLALRLADLDSKFVGAGT